MYSIRKLAAIALFMIPVLTSAQGLFVSTGIDARNAAFGSSVNPPAYDGTFSLGIRKETFQAELRYETFAAIDYQSLGVSMSYVHTSERYTQQRWHVLLGGELGAIHRDVDWLNVEYHLKAAISPTLQYMVWDNFGVGARAEAAWRGDLDKPVFSGYLEVQFFF